MGPLCDRWFLVPVLALAACAAPRAANPSEVERAVRETLERQVAAWNQGSIPGFMEGYERSPDTTFLSGAKLSRGHDAMLERYLAGYPAGKMGTLAFSGLEIRTAGDGSLAWVIGRYRLTGDATQTGAFTLVMRRDGAEYRIVHDHTSSDAPP